MKIRQFLLSFCCLLSVSVPDSLQAQTISVPPAGVPLRPVVNPDPAQPAPPTYEISFLWNEKSAGILTVPIKNESDKSWKVLGIQASGGIFIGDYPNVVFSKKEEVISFVYSAADNTGGEMDVIRLLTDQGIKEIRVRISREEVVNVDTREVRWTVGDKPEAKSVTLAIPSGAVVPLGVRVTGGNQAVLETVNATTWRVSITPGSTARSGQFVVVVNFDKALPGKAVVILGVIQPRE